MDSVIEVDILKAAFGFQSGISKFSSKTAASVRVFLLLLEAGMHVAVL